jgi:hypothetical protein
VGRRGFVVPSRPACNCMRLLGEDRPAIAEQNEKIGSAVEIKIDDGTCVLVRHRVEFFDQVDLAVEVPIRLATDERAVEVVVLLDVGAAVQIAVEGYFSELSRIVARAPGIQPGVCVLRLRRNVPRAQPRLDGHDRRTRNYTKERNAPG